jgi:hypothetical protein
MIDRDLFAIFPDLPWRRVPRAKIRKLTTLPKPPASRLHERRRWRREHEPDALRRIWIIAKNERRRAGVNTSRGRALAKIIRIASDGVTE